jgi:hypothetical protein
MWLEPSKHSNDEKFAAPAATSAISRITSTKISHWDGQDRLSSSLLLLTIGSAPSMTHQPQSQKKTQKCCDPQRRHICRPQPCDGSRRWGSNVSRQDSKGSTDDTNPTQYEADPLSDDDSSRRRKIFRFIPCSTLSLLLCVQWLPGSAAREPCKAVDGMVAAFAHGPEIRQHTACVSGSHGASSPSEINL